MMAEPTRSTQGSIWPFFLIAAFVGMYLAQEAHGTPLHWVALFLMVVNGVIGKIGRAT